MVPKAEIDGDMGDAHVGLQARLMSQALRKLAGVINKSNSVIVFRLDIRRVESIKQDGNVIGNRVRVKVVKNKVAPPFREAEFDIIYGKGISKSGNILDLAVSLDIINKSGAWFSYNGERIGQGRENAKSYLENNPKMMDEVETKVRKHFDEAFEKSLEGTNKNLEQNSQDQDEDFDEDFDEDGDDKE